MKYSRVNEEANIPRTGLGGVGLETVGALLKPKVTPVSTVRKDKPQPPIQPVSERFPAL